MARGFSDRHFERGEGPGDEVAPEREPRDHLVSRACDHFGERPVSLDVPDVFQKPESSPPPESSAVSDDKKHSDLIKLGNFRVQNQNTMLRKVGGNEG